MLRSLIPTKDGEPLFDLPAIELAVGAEEGSSTTHPRGHLYPVPKQPWSQEIEE